MHANVCHGTSRNHGQKQKNNEVFQDGSPFLGSVFDHADLCIHYGLSIHLPAFFCLEIKSRKKVINYLYSMALN